MTHLVEGTFAPPRYRHPLVHHTPAHQGGGGGKEFRLKDAPQQRECGACAGAFARQRPRARPRQGHGPRPRAEPGQEKASSACNFPIHLEIFCYEWSMISIGHRGFVRLFATNEVRFIPAGTMPDGTVSVALQHPRQPALRSAACWGLKVSSAATANTAVSPRQTPIATVLTRS
ncbi:hypothetical protein D9M69_400240 [compost metagenome]